MVFKLSIVFYLFYLINCILLCSTHMFFFSILTEHFYWNRSMLFCFNPTVSLHTTLLFRAKINQCFQYQLSWDNFFQQRFFFFFFLLGLSHQPPKNASIWPPGNETQQSAIFLQIHSIHSTILVVILLMCSHTGEAVSILFSWHMTND